MSQSDYAFTVDPSALGLPSRDELVDMRIWDSHYHGFLSKSNPIEQHNEISIYIERLGIERVISVEVGGTLADPLKASDYDEKIKQLIKQDKEKLAGITPIEPGYPYESCHKMEEWILNGPCIGIKYVGGNEFGITCDHPNNDRIIEFAHELGAVIYIHTWIKVGGDPRYAGGGNYTGESTPMDVARLAERFPDVQMICGHQGGDWELGIRAIRPHENVLLEFSGALPTSGAVDLAVNELGTDRLVWGGHGPSRSYANELSKVYDADLSDDERMKIFGRNYRQLAAPIMREKGYSVTI